MFVTIGEGRIRQGVQPAVIDLAHACLERKSTFTDATRPTADDERRFEAVYQHLLAAEVEENELLWEPDDGGGGGGGGVGEGLSEQGRWRVAAPPPAGLRSWK